MDPWESPRRGTEPTIRVFFMRVIHDCRTHTVASKSQSLADKFAESGDKKDRSFGYVVRYR